jgi:hypothetical protein
MGEYDHGRIKLAIESMVLLAALVLGALWPDGLTRFFTSPFFGINLLHLLWFFAVLLLLRRFVPRWNRKTSSGKIFGVNYVPVQKPSPVRQAKLVAYKSRMDKGAVRSAVYWGLVIVGTGLAYRVGVLNRLWLFEETMFFIFMDQFCVTVWCPFKWLITNKCCKTCRINNWGYFMAFSPLIWVPSFWTYSILFLSVAVVVQWEVLFHRYPERFYEGYNEVLTCKGCVNKCSRRFRQDAGVA